MARKLIETGLPLARLNAAASREKSIRRGHPSTLHLWWSRKPIGLARALLVAQCVDDPGEPAERAALLRLLADLAAWDPPPGALDQAAQLLRGALGPDPPTFLDPFCGGGSLPYAAAELGLPVLAADADPVAVTITDALLGGCGSASRDEVERTGRAVAERVGDEIAHAFPACGSLSPRIWLWARTAPCPDCGADTPLLPTFDLVARGDRRLRLTVTVSGGAARFGVEPGRSARPGNLRRRAFDCLICGATHDRALLPEAGRSGRLGRRLVAVAGRDPDGARRYVPPTPEQETAGLAEHVTRGLAGALPPTNADAYGVDDLDALFTPRQRLALDGLARAVAGLAGEVDDGVRTALGLAVSRTANRANAHCLWNAQRETVEHAFSRTTLVPMTWLFAESHPLADASGGFLRQVDYVAAALARAPSRSGVRVTRADARAGDWPRPVVVATDPPYFDTVDYRRLAGFFRPWLARALGSGTPDGDGAVASLDVGGPDGDGGIAPLDVEDPGAFAAGLTDALRALGRAHAPDLPLVLYFAYRGAGAPEGWVRLARALADARLRVTAVWPVRTERSGGLRNHRRTTLAGSVAVVCRPADGDRGRPPGPRREAPPGGGTPSAGTLRARLEARLPDLVTAGVPAVDLTQIAAGEAVALITTARADDAAARALLAAVPPTLTAALAAGDRLFDAGTRRALADLEGLVLPDGTVTVPSGDGGVGRGDGVAHDWAGLWALVAEVEAGRPVRIPSGARRRLTWLAARVYDALPPDRAAAARRLHELTSRWPPPS